MEDYSYIIDHVVKTEKMNAIVRTVLATLIEWAKTGQDNRTYSEMNHILGYGTWRGIGDALGYAEVVLRDLRKASGKDIPVVNGLCTNKGSGIPSNGFKFVYDKYDSLSLTDKKLFTALMNTKAFQYEHWDWVLSVLKLAPAPILSEEEWRNIQLTCYGSGGEGKEHKALKEYIKSHPEILDLKDVVLSETEHMLPSGDRLDVFFALSDGTQIAVEVKSYISAMLDVARGIFQCVKYEATMKAERKLRKQSYDIQTRLVVETEMHPTNIKIAEDLGVLYKVVRRK